VRVDEKKLGELFRDAVRDAPPASFDTGDVLVASRRATARHRTAVALGSTVAAVVLLGGTALGVNLLGNRGSSLNAASAPAVGTGSPGLMTPFNRPGAGAATPDTRSLETQRGGLPPKSIPESPPTQGGELSGSASPRAGSTLVGCGPVDRELAVALANELPAAAGAQPVPVTGSCPDGALSAGYEVRDGDRTGLFSVVVVPARIGGSAVLDQPAGSRVTTIPTSGGGTITVLSTPATGSTAAPFGDRVPAVADHLASQY
jgi:hypothetical protein